MQNLHTINHYPHKLQTLAFNNHNRKLLLPLHATQIKPLPNQTLLFFLFSITLKACRIG